MQKASNPPIPDPDVDPVKLESGLHWDPSAWNVSNILEWIKENISVSKQWSSLFSLLLTERVCFFLVCLRITSSSVLSVFRGTHSRIWREDYQSYSNRLFVISLHIRLSFSGDARLDLGASFGPDGSREGGVNELLWWCSIPNPVGALTEGLNPQHRPAGWCTDSRPPTS